MKYLSVCSGIEAATVAWGPLGWRAVAYAEIEKFPSAVLAHHYGSNMPDEPLSQNGTPNLGDITKHEEWPDYADIDVLVGGTPCQDFSIAGKRKGLDGERGNLTLEYARIAAKYRPNWMVWENVPGVFSSNDGKDYGSVLACFAGYPDGSHFHRPLDGWKNAGIVPPANANSYGLAWRVFDAQFIRVESHARAVPQRRRRVFVIGYLGDWRPAAAVLFERESMCGHPPPRRETGTGVAAGIASSLRAQSQSSHREDGETYIPVGIDGSEGVGHALTASHTATGRLDPDGQTFVVQVAPTLQHNGKAAGSTTQQDAEAGALVAHTLRGEGFDAREDGTGRGTPIVPVIAFSCKDDGRDCTNDLAPTLRSMNSVTGNQNAGGQLAIAVSLRGREGGATAELGGEVCPAIRTGGGGGDKPHVLTACDVADTLSVGANQTTGFQGDICADGPDVRRLTERECERLQGFEDDYTLIAWRGKPADQCPGGPRYKALGNSKATPPVRWIGERINQVEALTRAAR